MGLAKNETTLITQAQNGATTYQRGTEEVYETLFVYSLVIAGVFIIHQMEIRGQSILVPMLWALGALLPNWREGSYALRLGLHQQRLLIDIKYFVISCIVLLPLYVAGLWLLQQLEMPQSRITMAPGVSLMEWILYQFALVAVFEELFFRGYLQRRFERIASTRIAGKVIRFWLPIVASAALFAFAHVIVDLNPASFSVFVSGLVFAWLRAATGSLVAPILCHGSVNVFLMFALEALYA